MGVIQPPRGNCIPLEIMKYPLSSHITEFLQVFHNLQRTFRSVYLVCPSDLSVILTLSLQCWKKVSTSHKHACCSIIIVFYHWSTMHYYNEIFRSCCSIILVICNTSCLDAIFYCLYDHVVRKHSGTRPIPQTRNKLPNETSVIVIFTCLLRHPGESSSSMSSRSCLTHNSLDLLIVDLLKATLQV